MSAPPKTYLSAELILRLQTTAGNRAVQKLIGRRRLSAEAAKREAREFHPLSFKGMASFFKHTMRKFVSIARKLLGGK
jgi:hypothetical protein